MYNTVSVLFWQIQHTIYVLFTRLCNVWDILKLVEGMKTPPQPDGWQPRAGHVWWSALAAATELSLATLSAQLRPPRWLQLLPPDLAASGGRIQREGDSCNMVLLWGTWAATSCPTYPTLYWWDKLTRDISGHQSVPGVETTVSWSRVVTVRSFPCKILEN